jgi:hypothetical protein
MADHLDGEYNSAAVLFTNNNKPSGIMCIGCAELELELTKARIELRSTLKIIELWWEEMSSATSEVRNMASVRDEDCLGAESVTDHLQENDKALGCAIGNSASQSVKTIFESLVETENFERRSRSFIRKTGQHRVSDWKKRKCHDKYKNTTYSNAWRTDLNNKFKHSSDTGIQNTNRDKSLLP